MLINRSFKVWLATEQNKAGGRTMLRYVSVVRPGHWDWLTLEFINNFVDPDTHAYHGYNGAAIATDGFVLAIVPVILTTHDWPGLVHWSHFKKAFTATKIADMMPCLQLFPGLVRLDDGSTWDRLVDGGPGPGRTFPDVERVVPIERPHVPENSGRITLNPKLTKQLIPAIASNGRSGMHDVRFIHTEIKDTAPLLVERTSKTAHDFTGLPIGIQMPMVSTQSGSYGDFIARFSLRQVLAAEGEEE